MVRTAAPPGSVLTVKASVVPRVTVAQALSEELNRSVRFVPDSIGATAERWTRSLPDRGVALLENLRFYAEEERNDRAFAMLLSVHGDLYINDAPSSSALRHASIDAIVPLMPAYAGPQLVAHVAQLEAAAALALPGVAALRAALKVPEKI